MKRTLANPQNVDELHFVFPWVNFNHLSTGRLSSLDLSDAYLKRHRMVPFAVEDGVLKVALADPLKEYALNALQLKTGLVVEPYLCSEEEILRKIEMDFGLGSQGLSDLGGEFSGEGLSGEDLASLDELNSEAPAIRLFSFLVGRAASLGPARPVEALHPLARVLGDDLDVQKIREANKKQAKLKKMTLQIAKETDSSGLIEAIPWVEAGNRQRTPLSIVPKFEKEPPASPPEMSQEERTELERAIAEQAARIEAQPEYELPIFQRPYDKAAHLFDLHVDGGVQLFPKDLAFMREYWRSDEYLNVSKPRFDTLVDFYTQTTGRPVILPWQDPQADNATGIN